MMTNEQNKISICIDTHDSIEAGYDLHRWVDLPLSDSELDDVLYEIHSEANAISSFPCNEFYIADIEVPEGFTGLKEVFSDIQDPKLVNLLAKQLDLLPDKNIEAATAWINYDNITDTTEIFNVFYQSEVLPYTPYVETVVATNDIMAQALLDGPSDDYKLGHTVIENYFPDVMHYLADINVNNVGTLAAFFDEEKFGYALSQSTSFLQTEHGFLDLDADFGFKNYSLNKITENINAAWEDPAINIEQDFKILKPILENYWELDPNTDQDELIAYAQEVYEQFDCEDAIEFYSDPSFTVEHFGASDYTSLVKQFHEERGVALEDGIRGYSSDGRGGFYMAHGGNYDWKDQDLYGFDCIFAPGEAAKSFENFTKDKGFDLFKDSQTYTKALKYYKEARYAMANTALDEFVSKQSNKAFDLEAYLGNPTARADEFNKTLSKDIGHKHSHSQTKN